MSSTTTPRVQLIDRDGDPMDSGGALKVQLVDSTDNIDIGNVDLMLDGGVPLVGGNGAVNSGTLRVTIASDTTGVLSVDDNGSTLSIDDGGGVITVDGTVTANLSSTDNTVLDNILTKNTEIDAVLDTIKVDTEAIETAVELLDNAISGSEMQVDVVASLPSGSNTIGVVDLGSTDNAVLDAMVVDLAAIEVLLTAANVDHAANEVLLTAIDSDTDAIKTAVQILDNAISGSEMQVDVVASLPAGTNAIGKLAANSGVDIGDVDVTSTVHPVGNGTFNSYAQFTAATSPTALTDASNGVNGTETAAKEVIIQADFDNSAYIMVGDSGSTADTNGIRLNAGDTIVLPVANIANIYIDASTGSQTVNVTVIK